MLTKNKVKLSEEQLLHFDIHSTNNMDSEGSSFPPPPPPPPPGSMGAIQIPTYKEQQQQRKPQQSMAANEDQYLNLPPQLLSTMNKDKKPFTYTPNSLIGEKGLLDLSQIKSPRMKKRLMENQNDDEEKQKQREQQRREQQELQPQPQEQQKQYFPVSPPRKLNILQEVKEQQQYQQPDQQQYQPITPPLLQPVYSPPIQQQPMQAMYSTSMQQQPQFEEQAMYRNPPPPPPIRQHESIASPPVCSTSVFPNLNKQPKPFQRFESPKVDSFPQYAENQQHFNITPPKKIDIYKETHEQPTLPKSPVYVPTLQDQWQQRKQQQQQTVPNKTYSQPRQPPIQTPPIYDYADEQKPIQSKSFKILQQIVHDDDQQIQWPQQQQQRPQQQQQQLQQQQQQAPWRIKTHYDDKTSQMNTFRYTNSSQEHHEEHRERIIPIHIERQPQQNQQFYTPAAHQERIKTAPMYQGASIPSRSFRLLQMMTDTEQQQSQYFQPQRVATGFEGTDF